jgi:hypothetical protein
LAETRQTLAVNADHNSRLIVTNPWHELLIVIKLHQAQFGERGGVVKEQGKCGDNQQDQRECTPMSGMEQGASEPCHSTHSSTISPS